MYLPLDSVAKKKRISSMDIIANGCKFFKKILLHGRVLHTKYRKAAYVHLINHRIPKSVLSCFLEMKNTIITYHLRV